MLEIIILDKKYLYFCCVFKYFLKRNWMFFLVIICGLFVRNVNFGELFLWKYCYIIGWVVFCCRVCVNYWICIWECFSRFFVFIDVINLWIFVRRNFILGSLVVWWGIVLYNSYVVDLLVFVILRGYNVFFKVFEISYDLFGDKRGDNFDEGEF